MCLWFLLPVSHSAASEVGAEEPAVSCQPKGQKGQDSAEDRRLPTELTHSAGEQRSVNLMSLSTYLPLNLQLYIIHL